MRTISDERNEHVFRFLQKIAWQWWQDMRFAITYTVAVAQGIGELVALVFTPSDERNDPDG